MNNYQNYSMDDIIFENRNKQYGAYQLRKDLNKHTIWALLLTTMLVSLLILFVSRVKTSDSIIPDIKKVDANPTIFDDIKPLRPTPPPPKVIQTPQATQAPATVPTRDFREIQVTQTPSVIENTPPKQEELLTAMVGTKDVTETSQTASVSQATTSTIGTTTTTSVVSTVPEKQIIEKWVEVMPSFVGGDAALKKYLQSKITMDSRDVEIGISGKVIIQFYVDIDGSIKEAKVVKDGAGGSCAARALAIVKNMPKWNPGKQGNKPVRVYYSIPISFQVKN